jgi:hypothetical protein
MDFRIVFLPFLFELPGHASGTPSRRIACRSTRNDGLASSFRSRDNVAPKVSRRLPEDHPLRYSVAQA